MYYARCIWKLLLDVVFLLYDSCLKENKIHGTAVFLDPVSDKTRPFIYD